MDDDMVIAGRAEKRVVDIAVSLGGHTHSAKPQAEGLWLMLIAGPVDPREGAVRAFDRHGALTGGTCLELPELTGHKLYSLRSRGRRWLSRGLRRLPRGITYYGRVS